MEWFSNAVPRGGYRNSYKSAGPTRSFRHGRRIVSLRRVSKSPPYNACGGTLCRTRIELIPALRRQVLRCRAKSPRDDVDCEGGDGKEKRLWSAVRHARRTRSRSGSGPPKTRGPRRRISPLPGVVGSTFELQTHKSRGVVCRAANETVFEVRFSRRYKSRATISYRAVSKMRRVAAALLFFGWRSWLTNVFSLFTNLSCLVPTCTSEYARLFRRILQLFSLYTLVTLI